MLAVSGFVGGQSKGPVQFRSWVCF